MDARSPETPVTFVTAIYERNPDDALGGRCRLRGLYFESLARLAHLGGAWVVYTSPAEAAEVAAFCRSLPIVADVIAFPLENTPRFTQIQDLRERQGVRHLPYRDRCHALCFAKMHWLACEAAAPRFGSDRVFWIDAGLAQEVLFPQRLRRSPEAVFSVRTVASLRGYPGLLLLAHPMPGATQHDVSLEAMQRATGVSEPIRRHVVGGLFGGRCDQILALGAEFETLHRALLGAGLLGTEENVLSLLAAKHPAWPIVEFDTWYHEESDVRKPLPGERSFHALFENWARLQTPEIRRWPFAAAAGR